MTPHDCAMNFPLRRVAPGYDYNAAAPVDACNFEDGGETVHLEHAPRGMPITFVGDEPAEPSLWTGRALYTALGMTLVFAIVMSAFRG